MPGKPEGSFVSRPPRKMCVQVCEEQYYLGSVLGACNILITNSNRDHYLVKIDIFKKLLGRLLIINWLSIIRIKINSFVCVVLYWESGVLHGIVLIGFRSVGGSQRARMEERGWHHSLDRGPQSRELSSHSSLSLLPDCEGAAPLHLSSPGKVTVRFLTVSHNKLFLSSVVPVRNVASTTRKVKNIPRKNKTGKDSTHVWDLLWNICTIADFWGQDGNNAQKLLLWGQV